MKNVLVLIPLTDEQKARLESIGPDCRYRYSNGADVSTEDVQSANVIIGFPIPAMIRASDKLEFLQLSSSGADAYVKPGVLRPGTVLCSVTGLRP